MVPLTQITPQQMDSMLFIHLRVIYATKNTTIDGKVIFASELVVTSQYICSIQEKILVLDTTTTVTEYHISNTYNN